MAQKTKKKSKKAKTAQEILGKVLSFTLSVLFLVIVACAMVLLTRQLYQFGYTLFGEQPGTGVEVQVEFEVFEGESAMTTAERLKEKNLIAGKVIFMIQKILYEKDIVPGTHILHSNMTTLQVLDELSTPMERLNDH